jgi:hypothetical protein
MRIGTTNEPTPDGSSDPVHESPQSARHYVPQRPSPTRSQTTSDNITTRILSTIDLLPFTEQGDLGYIHRHRQSHAAEMGQLLPRPRRSRISSEYPPSSTPSGTSIPREGVDYINHHPSHSGQHSQLVADPSTVPFKDFVESHPVPCLEPRHTKQLNDENEKKETHNRPQSKPSYQGHSHRNSATRIVNSGFEVLPAGTFDSVGEPSDWSVDLEGGEKRETRKLKKERISDSSFTGNL